MEHKKVNVGDVLPAVVDALIREGFSQNVAATTKSENMLPSARLQVYEHVFSCSERRRQEAIRGTYTKGSTCLEELQKPSC